MPAAPASAAGAQPPQPWHRSGDRPEATGLALENGSQRAVDVAWLDDSGEELAVQDQPVFYTPRLPPGVPSFVRWRAVISEPRQQPWAPPLHRLAGPQFCGAVRALLLCHRRLAAMRAGAAARPGGAWCGRLRSSSWLAGVTLGDLPQELLLPILQAAAPEVTVLLDPPLPDGMLLEELPAGAATLFRQGDAPLLPPAEPLKLLISLLVLGEDGEEEGGEGGAQALQGEAWAPQQVLEQPPLPQAEPAEQPQQ
ncbi:hypothetical protein ABPG75_006519 [Micractinium tetrahymenae]